MHPPTRAHTHPSIHHTQLSDSDDSDDDFGDGGGVDWEEVGLEDKKTQPNADAGDSDPKPNLGSDPRNPDPNANAVQTLTAILTPALTP